MIDSFLRCPAGLLAVGPCVNLNLSRLQVRSVQAWVFRVEVSDLTDFSRRYGPPPDRPVWQLSLEAARAGLFPFGAGKVGHGILFSTVSRVVMCRIVYTGETLLVGTGRFAGGCRRFGVWVSEAYRP